MPFPQWKWSQHALSLLQRASRGETLRLDKTVSMKMILALVDGGYLYVDSEKADFFTFRITMKSVFALMDSREHHG